MPTLKALKTNRNKAGFTLLELLVVMTIIGLSFAAIAPKLGQQTVRGDDTVVFFNEIIDSHLKTAKELNRQVSVKGTKGSDSLVLADGRTVRIPAGNISESLINGERTEHISYYIYFYPDGLFDEFLLKAQSGRSFSADPMTKTAAAR